jgi:hypothetical protein
MKRYLMTVIFSFGLASGVFAASSTERVHSGSEVRVGLEAGMIISSLSAPSDLRVSNRAGFTAGINLEVPLSSYVALLFEAMYVQRGADLINAGNIRFSARTDSIALPVLVKLKLNQELSPFLVAGPVVIFNVNNSIQALTPTTGTSVGYNPRTADVALAIGGGVDVGPVTASVRYTYDLTDQGTNSVELHSRGVNLLVGLRL